MTSYYLMETDNFLNYGVTKNPKIGDELSFLTGKIINQNIPSLIFEVNFPPEEKLPHFLGNEIPLFSKELVNAIQKSGIDSFQVFPAKLINPETGQNWDNYLAFNSVGVVKAANLEKSNFDVLMEGDDDGIEMPLLAFREIVLDKNNTKDILMFRMIESPINLVVHSDLVAYLGSNRPANGWGVAVTELESV